MHTPYSFSVHESKSCLGVNFMDNVRMEHVCVLLVGMGDTAPLRRVPICAATMVNVGAISLETGDATVRMVGMGKIVPPSWRQDAVMDLIMMVVSR